MMVVKIFSLGLLLLLAGCGGGGGDEKHSSPDPKETGIFLDALVEGLRYETPSFSGFTNSAGEYNYLPDEMVTFYVGDIVLGTAQAVPVVTPLSLVPDANDPTDPVVTNIVRLLLTLDQDGNPDNGILITSATNSAANGLTVDFTAADFVSDSGVSSLLTRLSSLALVDATTAQNHFSETLAAQSTWGGMRWGNGTFRSK